MAGAGPSNMKKELKDFCEDHGKDGNNTIWHCLACKALFKGVGDSKQWTIKGAPVRALAHIAKSSAAAYTVRSCKGKYTAEEDAVIKQLWQAQEEKKVSKKRRSEDGEAVIVLDGRPPLPLDPDQASTSRAASTSQRTLPSFFNIRSVRWCCCWCMHGGACMGSR